MKITEYIDLIKPLSIHAHFAIGLRIFERYVRVRGLEDQSVWEYLSYMWEFPLLPTLVEKIEWEKKRGDLVDFGLGDELPEELEEELASLAINEDYIELWVTNVTELVWGNLLHEPDPDESLHHLTQILNLAAKSEIGIPEITPYKDNLFLENGGWGKKLSSSELEIWQSSPCSISLEYDGGIDTPEAVAFFD